MENRSTPSSPNILLLLKGNVVGTAQYCFDHGTRVPLDRIHGRPLAKYAADGVHLVAIRNVEIFREHESERYPYYFGDSIQTLEVLGELNVVEKCFKSIIAWDDSNIVRVPVGELKTLFELGKEPRFVSGNSVRYLKHLFENRGKLRSNTNLPAESVWMDTEVATASIDAPDVPYVQSDCVQGNHDKQDDSSNGKYDEDERAQRFDRQVTGPVTESRSKRRRLREPPASPTIRRSSTKLRRNALFQTLVEIDDKRSGVTSDKFPVVQSNRNEEPSIPNSFDRDYSNSSIDDRGEGQIQCSAGLSFDHDEAMEEISRKTTCKTQEPTSYLRDVRDNFDGNLTEESGIVVKKRHYMFKKRQRAPRKEVCKRKEYYLKLAKRPDNPFLKPMQCCLSGCFDNTDPVFAFAQYKRILAMNREERKRTLISFLDHESRKFRFNGKEVCARFLTKAFHFSACIQSCVKGTEGARAGPDAQIMPRIAPGETKRDAIVGFLRRLAEDVGDVMPNLPHTNIPTLTKLQVYERFCTYFLESRWSDMFSLPSRNYFYRSWKEECSNIKTHRNHGFATCSRCEQIRSRKADNLNNEKVLAALRMQHRAHLEVMIEERRGYGKRKDLAIEKPEKYCSIIVDGADQKSYGLPHFVVKTKTDTGHKLKVKCVGILEHLKNKRLSLFTMTEEFESGANHVIEAVHRALNRKKDALGSLPPVLFIQVDNCTRENKNHFFFAYFEMLVARGVFSEVQVSFLPVGHTHTDIDQAFSSVATRLRTVDALTMEDLLTELRQCYQPRAFATEILQVANFSGLCELSKCLYKVKKFSIYRYFRFTVGSKAKSGPFFETKCHVKVLNTDPWISMNDTTAETGFLKFVPDLQKTPPLKLEPPPNVADINKCLRSHEDRIKNREKQVSLENLRDRVYSPRVDPLHWDLESAFEMNGDLLTEGTQRLSEVLTEDEGLEDYDYTPNCFVAVKAEDECGFWIARVLKVAERNTSGVPKSLAVVWYSARGRSSDAYNAQYAVSLIEQSGKIRTHHERVETRTVLCQFEKLTTGGKLHVATQKAIRQACDEN